MCAQRVKIFFVGSQNVFLITSPICTFSTWIAFHKGGEIAQAADLGQLMIEFVCHLFGCNMDLIRPDIDLLIRSGAHLIESDVDLIRSAVDLRQISSDVMVAGILVDLTRSHEPQ